MNETQCVFVTDLIKRHCAFKDIILWNLFSFQRMWALACVQNHLSFLIRLLHSIQIPIRLIQTPTQPCMYASSFHLLHHCVFSLSCILMPTLWSLACQQFAEVLLCVIVWLQRSENTLVFSAGGWSKLEIREIEKERQSLGETHSFCLLSGIFSICSLTVGLTLIW